MKLGKPTVLKSTSYGRKLTIAFGVVIAVVSMTIPVALWSFMGIHKSSQKSQSAAASLGQVVMLQGKLSDVRIVASIYAHEPSPQTRAALVTTTDVANGAARRIVTENPDGFSKRQRQLANNIAGKTTRAKERLQRDILRGTSSSAAMTRFDRSMETVQQSAGTLANELNGNVKRAGTTITKRITSSALLFLAVLGAALLIAATLAYLLPRKLMKRVNNLRMAAHRLAGGDLAARADVDSNEDEVADLITDFNAMASALHHRELENAALQQQLRLSLESEQERATRDPLTSLRNHSYFQDSLRAEIDRCTRTGSVVSIACIDLDNFKQVNDTYGHSEGDAVLLRATQAISENLRPYDLACRLGGEEFGIIFPEATAEEAQAVLDRIARAIEFQGPNGNRCTFSGGIATYPLHASNQNDLYMRADEGAYAAKGNGKDQTVIYDPTTVVALDSEERAKKRSQDAVLTTARTLVAAVDAKDPYTRNHSELVAAYCSTLGHAVGMDEEDLQRLYQGGLLHDVGKIGISDAILTKPGRLTEDEYNQIKQHSEFSYRIIQYANIDEVATWVRHHHEHWDGSGYPHGLAGEAIPLASRIILIADAFEAMTSDRVYRRALTVSQALEELQRNAGRQFDPQLVQIMVQLAESGVLAGIRAQYGLSADEVHPLMSMRGLEGDESFVGDNDSLGFVTAPEGQPQIAPPLPPPAASETVAAAEQIYAPTVPSHMGPALPLQHTESMYVDQQPGGAPPPVQAERFATPLQMQPPSLPAIPGVQPVQAKPIPPMPPQYLPPAEDQHAA